MPALRSFRTCRPDRPTQVCTVAQLKARLAAVEQADRAAGAQLEEIECLLAQAFEPAEQGP